jgi:ribonuclease HI
MELLAFITGLNQITNKSIPVEVYSDSKYIVSAMTQGWIENWRSRDWINTRKKEVANRDLWEYLSQLTEQFDTITFNWIKGHNGHPGNEQADQLAREGMELGAYAVELSV